MSFKRLFPYFTLGSFILLLASCTTTPPTQQETQGEVFTEGRHQVTFSDIPGWNDDDVRQVWPAFMNSCRALGKKEQWRDICLDAQSIDQNDGLAVRHFFESNFIPYRVVGENGSETGMATGYYEPLLQGSRNRKGIYQTALYREPADLLTIDLTSAYPQLKGIRLRGKLDGKRVVPYETRGELEKSGKLSGNEIVWVDDALDAFFLEIQGSGRVHIPETGETIRVAYANQNGRPYRSIGRYLIDKGELKSGQASAQQIKKWLKKNPERFREVLDSNPSYVFFREEKISDPGVGPNGAQGVPLTPERSIAVDPRYVPLGTPVFIDTTRPYSATPLKKLVMAQDTGGAIRGAIRADYFWGFGSEAAEQAGKMKQKLKVWLLLPKQPDGKTEN